MAKPESWFEDVCELARRAGDKAHEAFFEGPRLIEKGHGDWASEADLRIEHFIKKGLVTIAPDTRIIGEESADDLNACDSETTWVWHVDPIDGSANFVRGIAHFATVISLSQRSPQGVETTRMGITYDPCKKELFTAIHDEPTRLNASPIRVNRESDATKSLLAIVTPKPSSPDIAFFGAWLIRNMSVFGGIRRSGAMALDLAWLGAGRLDAFAGISLAPWDIRAGLLQVKNAGGVYDFPAPDPDKPSLSPIAPSFCFAANSAHLLRQLKGDSS